MQQFIGMLAPPSVIDASEFDQAIPLLPNSDGVFVVWAGGQSAYLAKTGLLRRRLERVLRPAGDQRRSLNLRMIATRVEYWPTGSRFESGWIHYQLARRQFPDSYLRAIKLRMPAYVRLNLDNPFPRTHVIARLMSGKSLHYGPFRARSAAERFETEMLDLFQIRRCQEDLAPHPGHPGCIYGEMNMCLRPCQQVVHAEEYRSEVDRVAEFLVHNGRTLIQTISGARERLSEEMNFEEAARQHKRLEGISQLLALRDDLACDIDGLFGVAVTPSASPDCVKLWFVCRGCWQAPYDLALTSGVSLDRRLREVAGGLQPVIPPRRERQEHLAILARWVYSSFRDPGRDGEWVQFASLEQAPYRKIVKAISRVQSARLGQQAV